MRPLPNSPILPAWLLALVLILTPAAQATAGVDHFKVEGAWLGMTPDDLAGVMRDVDLRPLRAPGGVVNAYRATVKEGFTGGGLFQVTFARKELEQRAYLIVLNKRMEVKHQDLAPLLGGFVEDYGPYDKLCVQEYGDHLDYHAYWGSTAVDCAQPAKRPATRHLYVNLISGAWTEVFVSLSDPELLQANVREVKRAMADKLK